jgi:anti-sigma factor RsiW
MTRTCASAQQLIHLYLDDRLNEKQAEALQRHLSGCAACREELSALLNLRLVIIATDIEMGLTPERAHEPADLTDAIMQRVAAYEIHKAEAEVEKRTELERRRETLPDFFPARVGWRSVGVSVVLVALLVTALLPGGWGAVADTLARDSNGVVGVLLSPGPNQISWAVWLGGGLVTLMAVVWFVRADASSEWRRAISERLPQLW